MKVRSNKISILLVCIILSISFIYTDLANSYANESRSLIEVETYGNSSRGGSMFGDDLWAPGVERSGIIRIKNNYSQRIRVNNLALVMKLEKPVGGEYRLVEDANLIDSYAKSMKLKITRGRFLIFNETLYNESFYEMLYEAGNSDRQGYQLPMNKQFNIARNDSLDLKYTVTMDGQSSGNELQGLRATVDFIVNLHENPIETDPRGPIEREEDEDELIEEPIIVIPDISGHWAEECILRLIRKGIIIGYSDGLIRPDNNITRAEVAVLVRRALGIEESKKLLTGYLDPIPRWARGSVIATTEADIFEGYPNRFGRVFKPHKNISREQMAAVLIRGFRNTLEGDTDVININFTDKIDISDWAIETIELAIRKNVIKGYPDNTFRPKDNITRAEAFVMICRLLGESLEN